MKVLIRYGLLLTLVLGLVAVPAAATDLAVANGGQLLRLHAGAYGDLFPDGKDADPRAQVLALEVMGPTGSELSLVPSTTDLAPELSPTLYHDPTVDMTYVLWSSRHNGVHPYLRLARFSESGWSDDELDITGSVFAVKNDPQLSVHHETWVSADGTRVDRTVFFVIWWERSGNSISKRMSALILEDGSLVGSTSIQTLDDFVAADSGKSASYTGSLLSEVRLLGTDNGLTIGFVSASGRLHILTADVLPVELSRVAAAVEDAIRGFEAGSSESLYDHVVETLLAHEGFHPATLYAMAESVLALIEGSEPGPMRGQALRDLAEKAGPHIVNIGARFKAGGLQGRDITSIEVKPDEGVERLLPAHHLAMTELASFESPDLPEDVTGTLFVSKRGTAALVAWDADGGVAYREATADGSWGEVNHLKLDAFVDRNTAYRILEERTLER